ncbi:protein arginine methyltransferase NDUFAF7, mitochondrial-like [Cylas formicarius]|uniref:protein arginine methyltransferase NDUFAF7, mitochondrial-like n=2 Tax=Cylas formicarius TaxID=197179 RepID=UPI00295857D2|nr:protein arginine methyltransferase NDUFAF7, mitochondrial-like [Cylas formicarius]XP_060517661.1 protein arginine methyltransferase NDUFAF7, mitochondrial-like [Cylas formicarius]
MCALKITRSILWQLSNYTLLQAQTTTQTIANSIRFYYTVKRKVAKDENYLSKHLYDKIRIKGPITVAEYMKVVLQNPMQGYYMSKDMFGEKGDFVTSPEITQIFGEMLAVWFLNEWQKIGCPKPLQIIELGPGRGTLSSDIVNVFSHFKALHNASLHLVEISPVLSDIQAGTLCLQSSLNNNKNALVYRHGISRHGIPVSWYKQLKDVPEGFTLLLAHEFFDALPIHKFHKTYAGYKEVLIDIDNSEEKEYKFRYVLAKNDTPMLKVLLKSNETRDHVEISADSLLIYEQICQRLASSGGIALICDYGHNGTGTDTFRAFKKHTQVNPLVKPGTADLTADVDFSLIRDIANKTNDVLVFGPAKQKNFLQRIGIEHRVKALAENMEDKKDVEHLNSCYKFLTEESKMGERFKFVALMPATMKKIIDKYPVVGFV